MVAAWTFTLIPAGAAIVGAAIAAKANPSPTTMSAVQHFAAGVVFAAAASEILPDVMHSGSPVAVVSGGALGLLTMLSMNRLGKMIEGPIGLLMTIGFDILIDGLVLGIAFVAGAKAGILLTIALTIEVLFLGLVVANEIGVSMRSQRKGVIATAMLASLLPIGALLATSLAELPAPIVAGFFGFGLIALLYLVTEELLIEAHKTPDRPWVTAMFFVGFLILLVLENLINQQ